jgi:hypothetical protein
MKKENWIWMPHAGHLIVSRDCLFHLNTYVGKYIVSTVGEWWPDRVVREIHAKIYDKKWFLKNKDLKGDYFDSAYFKRFGYEELGLGRKYETMVFKAKKSKEECCPFVIITGELDIVGYNAAKDAYKGHLKMCNKWSKK